MRAGIVYACTGYGVVAAVDGLTGRIRHTFHYDRLFSLDPDVYDPALLFDTGGWDHEPVRLFGDRVVVAPSDSRYLYVRAGEPGPEGQQILDDPLERLDRRHLVGLRPDPAGSASPVKILSRIRDDRFGLVAIGPDGRTLAVSERLPATERVDAAWMGRSDVVSRPAVDGDRVYVPTSRGIRAYSLADLSQPPQLLDRPEGWPAPMSVHVTSVGLVALTPVWSDRQMYVECWKGRP